MYWVRSKWLWTIINYENNFRWNTLQLKQYSYWQISGSPCHTLFPLIITTTNGVYSHYYYHYTHQEIKVYHLAPLISRTFMVQSCTKKHLWTLSFCTFNRGSKLYLYIRLFFKSIIKLLYFYGAWFNLRMHNCTTKKWKFAPSKIQNAS